MSHLDCRSRVRLGDFPVGMHKKITSYHPEFVDVEEVVVHPKRDIALVKLSRSVNFTGKNIAFTLLQCE